MEFTDAMTAEPAKPSRLFNRPMRLSGKLAFAMVYENGMSRSRGPLKVFALADPISPGRMGLSVSRRVGNAPQRNRIKRLLRESFRHLDPTLRDGYDFIIVVRPHASLALAEYQNILGDLMKRLTEREKSKRGA